MAPIMMAPTICILHLPGEPRVYGERPPLLDTSVNGNLNLTRLCAQSAT
jgi:hypothetical protein